MHGRKGPIVYVCSNQNSCNSRSSEPCAFLLDAAGERLNFIPPQGARPHPPQSKKGGGDEVMLQVARRVVCAGCTRTASFFEKHALVCELYPALEKKGLIK